MALTLTETRRSLCRGLALCALLAPLAAAGCTAYSTWPPVPGEEEPYGKLSQINGHPAPSIMGHAVSFVTLRFPPSTQTPRGLPYTGPVAVNLPPGADTDAYGQIAERVSRDGRLCEPASASNRDLPTYHVTRVIVRQVTAEVDIVCPAPDYGVDAQGQPRYRGVTVYLSGGARPWTVDHIRSFPVGLFEVPERYEIEGAVPGTKPVLAP